MQKGEVYRNERLIGTISKGLDGYQFEYKKDYLDDPRALPISVRFPLRLETYTSPVLFPFFANMLAEGSSKIIQCRELRIDESDLFTRLLKTTENNTIGSITVKDVTVYRDSKISKLLNRFTVHSDEKGNQA